MLSEQRLNKSEKLNAANVNKLIQQTREAKENLLQVDAKESAQVTMLGSGSKLVGGTKASSSAERKYNKLFLRAFSLYHPQKSSHIKNVVLW